jgi:hypothetical protein
MTNPESKACVSKAADFGSQEKIKIFYKYFFRPMPRDGDKGENTVTTDLSPVAALRRADEHGFTRI